jgi:hypothetical protein
MTDTLLHSVIESGQDFEWYPTTQRMIDVVAAHLPRDFSSIMDIGAGDGRVLVSLAKRSQHPAGVKLYAIEKSLVLVQAQPDEVIPVGTDLFEQNLACLSVDYIFCNPPYSQFETWARTIIAAGYAKRAFLVIPQRWKASSEITDALRARGATARVVHSDHFADAERQARAVVDVVEVAYPRKEHSYNNEPADPFDTWFDQNIDTFDREEEPDADQAGKDLARLRQLDSIPALVAAFDEEYARMEENYRAIFKLDYALLKELGINKEAVREGIKKKMAGLKAKYWELLFEKLDTLTNRLSTATKKRFLEKLTDRQSVAFTANNAYAVVLWAIKNANKYYDEQLVQLFRDLSTFDGSMRYKSNQRTWKEDGWRYSMRGHDEDGSRPTHYALDYRIVVRRHQAIGELGRWEYPGGLYKGCHELIDDMTAVLATLGYALNVKPALADKAAASQYEIPSRLRGWTGGQWQDFLMADSSILFQVKGYQNGNVHCRFKPEAIKALNVEAGRLLGWLRSADDVVAELGFTPDEAVAYYGSSRKILPSTVKLLQSTKGAA